VVTFSIPLNIVLSYDFYCVFYFILFVNCRYVGLGSFPLYVYNFLLYGTPLFWGDVSDARVATRSLGQKSRKHPSTCYATPPQVDTLSRSQGNRSISTLNTYYMCYNLIRIPLFKLNSC